MNYITAAKSLIGRVRNNNEDNYCIDADYLPLNHGNSEMVCRTLEHTAPHLLGVFDGMGGYSDGEKASYLAAAAVGKYADRLGKERNAVKNLQMLCLEANEAVCSAADGSQIGTTCALLYINGSTYTVCNVGDSPIFLFRDGVLRMLSVDHTQKAAYEKTTRKPAPPGKKFPLTQCLGIPPEEMLIEAFTGCCKQSSKISQNSPESIPLVGVREGTSRHKVYQSYIVSQ